MSLSTLPLSYCMNVHPGRSIEEVEQGLDRFTVPVQHNYGAPLAAGLWLARSVVTELLQSPAALTRFSEGLAGRDLTCHTLNAFPYGDFHSERVKETVYIPDWSQPERLQYTLDCARILAALMPDGCEGSISSMPLGFKQAPHGDDFLDRCIGQLLEVARSLDDLHDETGKVVRLGLEPEPMCLLETTAETIDFFGRLWQQAERRDLLVPVRRHIGLCYDVCHQAVQFEDIAQSVADLQAAGVRINKVHITCAIHVDDPGKNDESRRALARYAEPRYLHQTNALCGDGRILRALDLSEDLAVHPEAEFATAEAWRVHFHVPVDAEELGPLGTTRTELKQALAAIARLDYAPHLEVETYTWEVMPGGGRVDLVDGLTRELTATRGLLADLQLNLAGQ